MRLTLSFFLSLYATISMAQDWQMAGNTLPGSGTGQTSPVWKLGVISGPSSGRLDIIHYNTPRIRINTNAMRLGNMSSPLFINWGTNNNVGIGTDAPTARLHVMGNMIAEGDLKIKTDATGIALRVNNNEMIWSNGTYNSWGFDAQYNYFASGLNVGHLPSQVVAPPAGGMLIKGNVGIGNITNPAARLHIDGGLQLEKNNVTNLLYDQGYRFEKNNSVYQFNHDGTNFKMDFTVPAGQTKLIIAENSNLHEVIIGSMVQPVKRTDLYVYGDIRTGQSLDVCGKITTSEVEVKSGWCDYVFDSSYQLMPIEDLEQFITKHHHLPNIPSAAEVETQGLKLAEMQRMMMEKIEELSLYIIALKKDNLALEALIKKQ